ncbi:MAG: DNA-directed RNA polymerase subunit alpha [Armatimonadota bacterium]
MLLMSNQTPKIERIDDRSDPTFGKFVVEPLERGYGTTLGSALRRVLLSSIPGTAVRSVRIESVLHEFSTIPGVVEDTTDLILNLKGVAFKIIPGADDRPADEPREVNLYRVGEGEVTAADVELPPDIEIANPEHHIASLSGEKAVLDMKMEVQFGTGFVAAEQQDRTRMPIGTIPIDSIYTPVRHVAFRVDPTRVGSATDYDRLTLEVYTNGTISPQEAISDAAKILDRYLILFFDLGEQDESGLFAEHLGPTIPGAEKEIKDMDFSVRTFNCLRKVGIATVGELIGYSEAELMAIKNFGRKSLNEVKEKLNEMGLSLRDSGEYIPDLDDEEEEE